VDSLWFSFSGKLQNGCTVHGMLHAFMFMERHSLNPLFDTCGYVCEYLLRRFDIVVDCRLGSPFYCL
jgi:hypothetical protein